jgi:hypothetical protein
MKNGLIPSMNDHGAWVAARQTYDKYGSDEWRLRKGWIKYTRKG